MVQTQLNIDQKRAKKFRSHFLNLLSGNVSFASALGSAFLFVAH